MKIKPYIFLFILFILLFFILGVRYGQKIEQANKTISYYLSLPPTKPPSPFPLPEFKNFIHAGCGISFLYPSSFTVEKNSSQEAVFTQNGMRMLSFSCFPSTITRPPIPKEWSQQFQDQEIQIHGDGSTNDFEFMLYHKSKRQYITFKVTSKYYPLFEKSYRSVTPAPTP